MRTLKLFVFVALALVAQAALADSWAPAATQRYVSADGAWRLTVEPRDITSPLAYFQDQVDGKDKPGGVPGSSQTSARGTMEHRVGDTWQRVWQQPLRNEVAPVDVVVLPGGTALTLDNWHSMGFGKDVVVLYDAQGAVVASYALADFLTEDYVRALPRSVSSLWWRGEAKALQDGKRVEVPVVIPNEAGDAHSDDVQHVAVIFDVANGKAALPAGAEWERALATARDVRAKQSKAEAEQRRLFIEPLRAPAVPDERALHQYMIEAFFRLDDQWKDDYPRTTVLRSPQATDYRISEQWVHDALTDDLAGEGAAMFASPSQDALVERIEIEARGIKPGALSDARLYFVLDDARFPRVQRALSSAGAKLIQLDPSIAIPQRPERLENFLQIKPDAGQ